MKEREIINKKTDFEKLKNLKEMLTSMINSNLYEYNSKIELTNYGLIFADNTPDSYCRLIISSASIKDDIKHGDYHNAYDTIYETLKHYPDIRNDLRSLYVLRDVLEEIGYDE